MEGLKRLSVIIIFCMTILYTDMVFANEIFVELPVLRAGNEEISELPTYEAIIPMGQIEVVYPVNITEMGTVYLECSSKALEMVKVSLWADDKGSISLGSKVVNPESQLNTSFTVESAGIYYVRFVYYTSDKNMDETLLIQESDGIITYQLYEASSENRTLIDNVYTIGAPDSDKIIYYRINVLKEGYIAIDQKNTNDKYCYMSICNSSKKTLISDHIDENIYYYPVKKGTYYLKTKGVSRDRYSLKYKFVSKITLKNNATTEIHVMTGTSKVYFKLKAEKTGTMRLYNTAGYGSYLRLCSSRKSSLTSKEYITPRIGYPYVTYTVKKGRTYYIEATGTVGEKIKLTYKLSALSPKKNYKKTKAKKLSKNRTVKGIAIAGYKRGYWYRFKVTKAKKLNISMSYIGLGDCTVKLYKGKKRAIVHYGANRIYTRRKLKKGTYYIKITPSDLSGFSYSIKLK